MDDMSNLYLFTLNILKELAYFTQLKDNFLLINERNLQK